MNRPAWIRWTLFAALVILGAAQLAAYVFFKTHSTDFIARNHNARALQYSQDHLLTLPARLRFGAGEADTQRLGDGWNLPEAGGVWSSNKDATIELLLAKPAGAIELHLNVAGYDGAKKAPNRLQVSVNGKPVAELPLRGADLNLVEITVPADMAQSGILHLRLHVDRCEPPLREGTGPDPRRLGVWLESADIASVDDRGGAGAQRIAEHSP